MKGRGIRDILRLHEDDLRYASTVIAEQVYRDGFEPEDLVVSSRGALVLGRYLSDLLGNPNVKVIRPEHYRAAGQRNAEVLIKQDIPEKSIRGHKVLSVDDVADTGKTQEKCHQHLNDKGVADLKTATWYIKKGTLFVPDYYVGVTEPDIWICFPFEENEVIRELLGQGYDGLVKKYFSEEEIVTAYRFSSRSTDNKAPSGT